MKKFSLSIALCLCTAFAAFGQTGGTITGTVASFEFKNPHEEASVGAVYDREFFLESTKYARS